jgi:rhamnogalacturonan endolyase
MIPTRSLPFCFLILILCVSLSIEAKTIAPRYNRIQMERLNRGMSAFYHGQGVVTIGWRLLTGDAPKKRFDLYRQTFSQINMEVKEVKLNEKPLVNATFFVDKGVDSTLTNTYILKDSKTNKTIYAYSLTPSLTSKPYLSIRLTQIDGDKQMDYRPNMASVGDLDGDGEYEIVLKRQIGNLSSCQRGLSAGTIRLEAYKLDGSRLWQMNLGTNIREGSSYFSFTVYDLDGDGKAEIVCKTAEGTVFGDGSQIDDTDGDGITDYVIHDGSLKTFGKILSGPEFISVIEGSTGKELARANFIERGSPGLWGDETGDNVDRTLGGIAYLDGKRPSYVAVRGAQGRIVMEAWDYRNKQLVKRWFFDTSANDYKNVSYTNQGCATLRVADIDGDGKDELVYGSCVVNNDGSGLYSTGWGYGESLNLTDIAPQHPGLEIWQSHSLTPTTYGSTLRDARSGKLLLSFPSQEIARNALCADIDPKHYGQEIWSSTTDGIYSCIGKMVSRTSLPATGVIWWDGDLGRELQDKFYIRKWTENGIVSLFDGKDKGLGWCNGSKGNSCLTADILGDWREEIILPSEDGTEIRIYSTPIPTEKRFICLMQDPVYRLGVCMQNSGNSQPAHPGFFLGNPKPKLTDKFLK